MSDYLNIERFAWFDEQVRRSRYPSTAALARRFEISPKTATRAIDFMRDRLGAPLAYEPSRKGWYYTLATFSLPYLQATQEEILAILIARQLLSASAGGFISREIDRFSRRLFASTADIGLTEQRLEEAFAARWPGFSPAAGETFRTVTQALLTHHPLSFVYDSPASGETTERTAEPHHLQHYMGSWVLTAWCRLRGGWRLLYLARMSDVALLTDTFAPRPPNQWRHHASGAYGIFPGKPNECAHLRFTPFRARWVRGEIWHPGQQITERPDGSLDLRVPVSDYREIKMKILSFGADVEVIAPVALKTEVADEIRRMGEVYDSGI